MPNAEAIEPDALSLLESKVCTSFDSLKGFFTENVSEPLNEDIVSEIRSVVEGAKALARVNRRVVKDPIKHPLAKLMADIEQEITNFDEKQRKIALVDVGGPARIRGLAGSGKTVILAMKAAHLHLNNPEEIILFTFLTKSLRATIKTLITKFYRQYSDGDPDWKKVHIRHGWGGKAVPGVYSQTCARSGLRPLTFRDAQRMAKRPQTPFAAICNDLVSSGKVESFYDHVLIDEGQDFPASFYKLAFALTKGEHDHKSIVWAYDELQDIMNVKIRPPSELFGFDNNGQPLVDLDRSSAHIPPGSSNDAVLSKAYRNQRDVLVSSHALGFGIYGTIVQMLESAEHWEDVGYTVETGALVTDEKVTVSRPDENSPLNVTSTDAFPLISAHKATDLQAESDWVAAEIKRFIDAGLEPQEILVISLDDRSAKAYLSAIAERLALLDISSNNIIADPYNEPPFSILGKVTLSTVYRAKGNEAALVFAVGVDAIHTGARSGRNKLFTAFTRTKAWLRVSGMGKDAKQVIKELSSAVKHSPRLEFTMPDLNHIETIQRGFSKKAAIAHAARKKYIKELRAAGLSEEEISEELQREITGGQT